MGSLRIRRTDAALPNPLGQGSNLPIVADEHLH